MQKSTIFRFSVLSAVAALAVVLTARVLVADQPFQLGESKSGAIPLAATISNGSVNFLWPVMPGNWQLFEQQPGSNGEWKLVPVEKYQTNGGTVTVILPLPNETSLFRVRRVLGIRPPNLPNLPPIPPPPTNLPPKFKPQPQHP